MSARVEFICPACNEAISAPPSLEGEEFPCPKCGADVDRWPAPKSAAIATVAPPAPAEAEWHYITNGNRRGPVTMTQLRALAEAGMLRPADQVWRAGSAAWVEASTVPGLFPRPRVVTPPALPPLSLDDSEVIEDAEVVETRPKRRSTGRSSGKSAAKWWGLGGGLGTVALVVVGFLAARSGGQGTRLTFNGGELYYTSRITADEANRTGRYLVREGMFDGIPKTVQLDREGGFVQFRVPVKKGLDTDSDYVRLCRVLASELSRDIFRGEHVEVHLCDERMNTLRVVVPLS